MKKITKTALILATGLSALLVASNSYADDSDGMTTPFIKCGEPGALDGCGLGAATTRFLKSGSLQIRGNGEIQVRLVGASSGKYAVYSGNWSAATGVWQPQLTGSQTVGICQSAIGYLIVPGSTTGKYVGKILTAPGVPYVIPNGTSIGNPNFVLNLAATGAPSYATNTACTPSDFQTGFKVTVTADDDDRS